MLLEAFFSTAAGNVLAEIIKRMIAKERLNERDVERIIENYLKKYQLAGQASVIEREIMIVLGGAGLIGSGGHLLFPPPQRFPALPELLGAWWDSRVYKIVSVFSEKALDVPINQLNDGIKIQLWDYGGGANQQWKLIPVSSHDGLFKIHSLHSAKVLDVPINQMANGIRIQQWSYGGGANQHWWLTPIDSIGEVFKIISAQSGKALDVPNNMTDNGVWIQQWDYWGGTNQQWRLMRVK